MTFPGFSPEAFKFLRSLARNNRREWFQPRKHIYESEIKQPMAELVTAINAELMQWAPRYFTPPQKAILRIYRDTRFSHNKTPYKTHVSALFPRSGAGRTSGACFYFHFTAKELLIFGGVWNPPGDELRAIRSFLGEQHEELRRILSNKPVRALFGEMQGERLTRLPAGFAKDHPAADWLRGKQWYLESICDAKLLSSPRLLPEVVKHFRTMLPLVEFFNQPLIAQQKKPASLQLLPVVFGHTSRLRPSPLRQVAETR